MNFIDKSQLSDKELIIFNQEVEANKKSPVVSYLLWWFTGVVGGHRYYFGKTASAITMTLIFFLLIWFWGLGAIITGCWAMIDVFFINSWLREDKKKIEKEVFDYLKNKRGSDNSLDSPLIIANVEKMTVGKSDDSKADNVNNQKYCSKCGEKLVDNATFCPYCGQKVEIAKKKEILTETTQINKEIKAFRKPRDFEKINNILTGLALGLSLYALVMFKVNLLFCMLGLCIGLLAPIAFKDNPKVVSYLSGIFLILFLVPMFLVNYSALMWINLGLVVGLLISNNLSMETKKNKVRGLFLLSTVGAYLYLLFTDFLTGELAAFFDFSSTFYIFSLVVRYGLFVVIGILLIINSSRMEIPALNVSTSVKSSNATRFSVYSILTGVLFGTITTFFSRSNLKNFLYDIDSYDAEIIYRNMWLFATVAMLIVILVVIFLVKRNDMRIISLTYTLGIALQVVGTSILFIDDTVTYTIYIIGLGFGISLVILGSRIYCELTKVKEINPLYYIIIGILIFISYVVVDTVIQSLVQLITFEAILLILSIIVVCGIFMKPDSKYLEFITKDE
ncbi:NINE protein [Ligilactobacillus agilis]|uniref:NINE protein n=1 Tax=Ligilactobacillus agilis TaxID=1601 RepID=UPI00320790A1